MLNNLIGAKRGGYIYTATLLLFLAVSFFARLMLGVFGAGKTLSVIIASLVSAAAFLSSAFYCSEKDVKKLKITKFSPVYILPTIFLTVGMTLGLGFLNTLVARGVASMGGKVADINIPTGNAFYFVLFSVVLCLLPAIAEELFFRGVLLDSLSDTHVILRVITVALCFSLYHGNVSQLAYQFVYGAGLCFLTLKAKSVIPAMIAHFCNNFFALTTYYFNIDIDLFNPILIVIGAVLLILFAIFTALYRKGDVAINGGERIKEFYIPFGIVGIAASILIIVLSAIPL